MNSKCSLFVMQAFFEACVFSDLIFWSAWNDLVHVQLYIQHTMHINDTVIVAFERVKTKRLKSVPWGEHCKITSNLECE